MIRLQRRAAISQFCPSFFCTKDYDFETRRRSWRRAKVRARAPGQLREMGLTALSSARPRRLFGGGAFDLMGVMEAFGDAAGRGATWRP